MMQVQMLYKNVVGLGALLFTERLAGGEHLSSLAVPAQPEMNRTATQHPQQR
jgi:hypothetical protein